MLEKEVVKKYEKIIDKSNIMVYNIKRKVEINIEYKNNIFENDKWLVRDCHINYDKGRIYYKRHGIVFDEDLANVSKITLGGLTIFSNNDDIHKKIIYSDRFYTIVDERSVDLSKFIDENASYNLKTMVFNEFNENKLVKMELVKHG